MTLKHRSILYGEQISMYPNTEGTVVFQTQISKLKKIVITLLAYFHLAC